ncbi:MAG TPA: acyloxyacyl hydrolase [Gemmatimonadaceae bacterium]|jgi:hypothetical protein|nr:acyloxyacyl hydrolase [Gemmatimonadaceae bacterium]
MPPHLARRATLLSCILVALVASTAAAQSPAATDSAAPAARAAPAPEQRFTLRGVWFGAAFDSPFATRLGRPLERDFYLLGLRVARPLAVSRTAMLEWTMDAIPLAASTHNPTGFSTLPECSGTSMPCERLLAHTSTAYAVGLAPVGLQLELFRASAVRLQLATTGGALWFTSALPEPRGTRFNFTADVGSTLALDLLQHYELLLGYRYHHTSNAGTGRVNPGLNAHMLQLGLGRGGLARR